VKKSLADQQAPVAVAPKKPPVRAVEPAPVAQKKGRKAAS